MKNIIILFALFFAFNANGQEEEVLFGEARVHGGFGSPLVDLTNINGTFGAMAGGGGAVIVGDFFFGGFGQGGSFGDHVVNNRTYPIDMGYGGLWIGYVRPTWKSFHFYSSLRIAGGGITLNENREDNDEPVFEETVFVLQPEVGIEFNLARWFRIALTGNYRLVAGIQPYNLGDMRNEDFNSFGAGITLRFGRFYKEGAR